MVRPVSLAITATASGVSAATGQAASSFRGMAAQIQGSARSASAAQDRLAESAVKLAQAQRKTADAASAVRIAETRLQQVRTQGNATNLQKVRAEEQLARSQRKLVAAQNEVNRATQVPVSRKSFLGTIEENAANYDRVGSALIRVGAAAAVGLGLSAKAAIDWQSDWAGVTKTVDGTVPQMAALEGELRGLAKTLPASHREIAGVAEAAGQLGVKRQDIASFTRTMIDLGETTNLSAGEAATSLAQFSNVMGTSSANVGRLGATIVALGNDGASTERDIVQMGQRIAGAGRQIGLSETEVLAFANTLASVGIEAEAGGTAISTSFLKMDQAVRAGGAGLETLARVSGKTTQQFADDFRNKPAAAMNDFVTGLGRVQAEGGDTTAILRTLGITGIRESDALRRMASAGDLLSQSLATSNSAWQSNSALVDEAAKRYATAESQARIAWNQIKDAAISAGTAMLPIIAQVATAVGTIASGFADLPGPVRTAAVSLAATVAVMGLVGGGALKAISGLAGLATAFRGMGIAATTAGRAVKIAQLSIPVVGVALFAATTALQAWAASSTSAATAANSYADAMSTVEGAVTRAAAAVNQNVRLTAVQNLQSSGALSLAGQLGISYATVADAALGNADAISSVNAVLNQNLALNPQVSKANADRRNAASQLAQLLNLEAKQNISAVEAEQQKRAAMEGGVGAAQSAADAAEKHATSVQQSTQALYDNADAAIADANALLALSGSQVGMEAAIDNAAEAAGKLTEKQRKSGDAFDANTRLGQQMIPMLNSVAAATNTYTNGLIKGEKSANQIAAANARGQAAFVKTAVAMGYERGAAEDLARTLITIPADIQSTVVVAGIDVSKKQAADLNAQLKGLPKEQRAQIILIAQTQGAEAAQRALDKVKDKNVIARAKGEFSSVKDLDAAMKALKDRKVKAEARGDDKAVRALDTAINALEDKTVKVDTEVGPVPEPKLPKPKPIKIPVEVQQAQANLGYDFGTKSKTVVFKSKVEPPQVPNVTGGTVTYTSKVEAPEAPTVTGGTVTYSSKVTPPKVPNVKGTITYSSKVIPPKAPAPKGKTIIYPTKVTPPKLPVPKPIKVSVTADVGSAKSSIGSVKAKPVKIPVTANTSAAKSSIAGVKGKTVTIKVTANTSAARSAINSVQGKTVTITVRTVKTGPAADGGLITPAGPVRLAGGGHVVSGIGGPRQDNIAGVDRYTKRQTSEVSVGEMVTNAVSTRKNIGPLTTINANPDKRYGLIRLAGGGVAGLAAGGVASNPSIDLATLLRLLSAATDPFEDIKKAMADIAKATKAGKKGLEDLKSATDSLKQAQKSLADAARSQAATLAEPYRSKSRDVDDVLESMREGAADLAKFNTQITQLRGAGLSETLVRQLTEQGAVGGSELADQILAGGAGLVKALNGANAALQKASDAIGFNVVTTPGRFASGGFVGVSGAIRGPGTGTSDSLLIRASNGEHITKAKEAQKNRPILEAINDGRKVVERRYITMPNRHGYGAGTTTNVDRSVRAGDLVIAQMNGSAEQLMRLYQAQQHDSLAMVGLR